MCDEGTVGRGRKGIIPIKVMVGGMKGEEVEGKSARVWRREKTGNGDGESERGRE